MKSFGRIGNEIRLFRANNMFEWSSAFSFSPSSPTRLYSHLRPSSRTRRIFASPTPATRRAFYNRKISGACVELQYGRYIRISTFDYQSIVMLEYGSLWRIESYKLGRIDTANLIGYSLQGRISARKLITSPPIGPEQVTEENIEKAIGSLELIRQRYNGIEGRKGFVTKSNIFRALRATETSPQIPARRLPPSPQRPLGTSGKRRLVAHFSGYKNRYGN